MTEIRSARTGFVRPSRAGRAGSPRAEARGEGGGSTRYAEFDALRATAILLVVALHAALGYTRLEIPRLLWAVRDPAPGLAIDLFCWWAMGVSVPLFFTMGGFFAAATYASRGPSGFVRSRVERVVVPFFVAAPVVLPASFLAWAAGWLASGRCTIKEVRRMRFLEPKLEAELYGPAHLWFLEYLILMLAAFWLARKALDARAARRAAAAGPDGAAGAAGGEPGRWLLAPWAPLALAVPTAAVLWYSRQRVGIDAALDRHNSFIPDPVRLMHQASFFAFGAGVHRARGRLDSLVARGPWYLLAAVPVFAGRAWLLRRDWTSTLGPDEELALAGFGALFSWLAVFGLVGSYRGLFRRPSPLVRSLAGSSYWVYLVHLPIVGLVQADLFGVPVPAACKFLAAWSLTMALGLASHHAFVRGTTLGRWLGSGPAPSAGRGAG